MRGRLRDRLCVIVIDDFSCDIKKWRSVVAGVTFFVDYLKIVGNVNRIEIIHNNAKVHKQKWMIDWYDFFFCGT